MFFLKVMGALSSFILIIGGMTASEGCCANESFYNGVGMAFIGLGCFTGPFLFGLANLIEQTKRNTL